MAILVNDRNIFDAVRFRQPTQKPGTFAMTWTVVIVAVTILVAVSAVRPAR
jgi:hypothetical protein